MDGLLPKAGMLPRITGIAAAFLLTSGLFGDGAEPAGVYSADGANVTCAAMAGGNTAAAGLDDGRAVVWKIEKGETAAFRAGAPVLSVAFSRDGRFLAAGDLEGGITVWDLNTGVEADGYYCAAPVGKVAFSPDGKRLLALSHSRAGLVLGPNAPASHDLHLFGRGGSGGRWILRGEFRAAFFADRESILALSSGPSGTFSHVFAVNSGEVVAKFEHGTPAYAIAWMPPRESILLGHMEAVSAWNALENFHTGPFRGESGAVHSIQWVPGTSLFYTAGSREILLRTMPTGEVVDAVRAGLGETFRPGLSISDDGARFMAVAESGGRREARCWSIEQSIITRSAASASGARSGAEPVFGLADASG